MVGGLMLGGFRWQSMRWNLVSSRSSSSNRTARQFAFFTNCAEIKQPWWHGTHTQPEPRPCLTMKVPFGTVQGRRIKCIESTSNVGCHVRWHPYRDARASTLKRANYPSSSHPLQERCWKNHQHSEQARSKKQSMYCVGGKSKKQNQLSNKIVQKCFKFHFKTPKNTLSLSQTSLQLKSYEYEWVWIIQLYLNSTAQGSGDRIENQKQTLHSP